MTRECGAGVIETIELGSLYQATRRVIERVRWERQAPLEIRSIWH